jgi:REP element-mobilizing transposase RayT
MPGQEAFHPAVEVEAVLLVAEAVAFVFFHDVLDIDPPLAKGLHDLGKARGRCFIVDICRLPWWPKPMPRQARIDAPGAVHHIIIRGIEQTAIFVDDQDREDFIKRLSELIAESQTPCYAWALMSNQAHLLLRTGSLIDLSAVIEAVGRYFGAEQKKLTGSTKQVKIARARALIGYMATQDLSIAGSEVARRLNIDRSAVSRAVQRARQDAELMAAANVIWKLLKVPANPH